MQCHVDSRTGTEFQKAVDSISRRFHITPDKHQATTLNGEHREQERKPHGPGVENRELKP